MGVTVSDKACTMFLIAVEAADAAVSLDEEEFPERLPHADAHKLRLPRAIPRKRRRGQRRPAVQAKGEDMCSRRSRLWAHLFPPFPVGSES